MDSQRNIPLVLMRIVIGSHFLYEGLTKLLYPGWTSVGYLKGSTGPLAPVFQWLGAQTALTGVIDFLNVWGLTAIGLALMAGVAVRAAAWCGIALLSLYYLLIRRSSRRSAWVPRSSSSSIKTWWSCLRCR